MPDVKKLIVQSWERVIDNLSELIKLLLLGWLAYALVVLVSSAWLLALGVTNRNIFAEATTNPMVLLESGLVLQSAVVLIVLMLLFVVITNLIAIVKIRVLTGSSDIIDTAKKNFKLILPLIGLNLLIWLLIVGGTWFLLIPGLVIYLFTIFASLELVLGEMGIIASIKSSVLKVKANFAKVLVRLLALAGLMAAVWGLSAAMLKSESLGGLLLSFLRVFAGWYGTAYIIELYKHLDSPEDKEGATWWVWLLGLLGWIVIIGLGIFVFRNFSSWGQPLLQDPALLPTEMSQVVK